MKTKLQEKLATAIAVTTSTQNKLDEELICCTKDLFLKEIEEALDKNNYREVNSSDELVAGITALPSDLRHKLFSSIKNEHGLNIVMSNNFRFYYIKDIDDL
ncbi:MAG: hypothetical protein ACRC5M_06615 [Anaeroplasmataceae bacterium]